MSKSILPTHLRLVQVKNAQEGVQMTGSYEQTILLPYIRSLIRENAKPSNGGYSLHIDDLDQIDQETFTAHLLKLDAVSQDEWAWVMEVDDGAVHKSFIKYMLSAKSEDMYDFSQIMMKYAVRAYKERMHSLIQSNISTIYHEDMQEAGLTWNRHKDNGEGYYSRW